MKRTHFTMQVLFSFYFTCCYLCSASMLLPSTDDFEGGSGEEENIFSTYNISFISSSQTTSPLASSTTSQTNNDLSELLMPYTSDIEIFIMPSSSLSSFISTVSVLPSTPPSVQSLVSSSLLQLLSTTLLAQSTTPLPSLTTSLLDDLSSLSLQSQTTPLPSQTTPLPSQTTPLPSQITPLPSLLLDDLSSLSLQSQTTPLPSQTTPLPSQITPLQSQTTPLPSLLLDDLSSLSLQSQTTPSLAQSTTPLPSLMSSATPFQSLATSLTTPLPSLTTPLPSLITLLSSQSSTTPMPSQTSSLSMQLPSFPPSTVQTSLLLPSSLLPSRSSSSSGSILSVYSSVPPTILTTPIRPTSSLITFSSVFTTPTPLLGDVPIVTVSILNASAIRVSWTPVSGSRGYNIYIRENRASRKRQVDEIVIMVSGGQVTNRVISGLKPFTSYSVSMTSIDSNGLEGSRSASTPPMATDEAAPSLPRNVTWVDLSDDSIEIVWLPPEFPNGIITSYVVILNYNNGTLTRYTVPGNQTMLTITKPVITFSVTVLAANGAGESTMQNLTTTIEPESSGGNVLSPGIIAVIVICTIILVLLVIATVITIIILWSKQWYKYHGGADINVDEIEYKAGDVIDFDKQEDDVDGQLTAKRWMRANTNYSVPTLLLPPISELGSSYRTAEDLVESNTITRQPSSAVLQTVGESSIPLHEQPSSTNSSSERSGEARSTLSSVCSKNHIETNKVVQQDETQFIRDSKLMNDDQAVFEMMENVYLASPQEMESLNSLELKDLSNIDMKEQIGIGYCTKVTRAVVLSSSTSHLQRDSEVAVKILNDDSDVKNKDNFLGAAFIMSQFSHKNIVSLLGISTTSSPLMAIFAYASLGDLKHYLTRVRRKTRLESLTCNFGLMEQLLISFQIAAGMEYLASKFFIHRALQAKYILLNEDYSLKIGGFRMSHSLARPDGYFDLKSTGLLPVKWLSLETLINGRFSSNTDIWSYGVLMWEIFAFGLTPFRGVMNSDVVVHLKEGKRLNKPSGCPDNIYALMLHCWVATARERPNFSILHTQLLSHYTDLKKNSVEPKEPKLSFSVEPEPSSLATELTNIENVDTQDTAIINESQEELDSMSADNSRVGLLHDYPSEDIDSIPNSNNCDLVLTSSTGTQPNSEIELSNTHTQTVYNFEHSLSFDISSYRNGSNADDESELYTKL